jgi:hypothetical protein
MICIGPDDFVHAYIIVYQYFGLQTKNQKVQK